MRVNKKNKSPNLINLILIVVPFIIFWQCLFYEFVWDDVFHISDNTYLNSISIEKLMRLWMEPYGGLYIPFSYTVWGCLKLISESIYGTTNPFLFHLVNIILHIINGFLVFHLLKFFIKNKWATLGGTLVFLVHPIQVESVAWVSEFRGLLSVCLGLSALHLYLKVENNFDKYYWSGLILFALAILSKPSAVSFVFFAIILDKVINQYSTKKTISKIIPWIIAVIPIAVISIGEQSSKALAIDIWLRPLIWMDAINFYLYKIINPISLYAIYGRTPEYVLGLWYPYLSWVIPVIIGLILWKQKRMIPILWLSFCLFICGFLPNSGFVPFTFQKISTVADRYIYLSMIGVSLAFAYGLLYVCKRNLKIVVIGYIIFLMGFSINAQAPIWKTSLILWNKTIARNSQSSIAYYNRGVELTKQNENTKALMDYNMAIELNPKYVGAYNNRGNLFSTLKEYKLALNDYGLAIELSPEDATTYYNRGMVFFERKQYSKALNDFNKAIKLNSKYSDAYNNKGAIFIFFKQYDKALEMFNKVIEFDPQFVPANKNRELVYGILKYVK